MDNKTKKVILFCSEIDLRILVKALEYRIEDLQNIEATTGNSRQEEIKSLQNMLNDIYY